jgi:hypothetical protein
MSMWKAPADSLTLLRALVTVLSICAMAALVLTALFGFEEPNDTLMLLSSGLLLTAIAAVFAHLGFTRSLNRSQKRIWFRQLTGRRAVRAWSEYLTCDDLRAAAIRFGNVASGRH